MNSPNPRDLTVFVVDDNAEMRESIEWTLASVGCHVKSFECAQDCLQAIDLDTPFCVIVDLLMPEVTGLQFCRQLLASHPNCAIIMISAHGDIASAVEAMKLGVMDFLEKPFSREALLNAVNRSQKHVIALYQAQKEENEVAARLGTLTSREQQVLECMSLGMVTKQIASKLGISPRTVDVHRSNISRKLEIDSASQLSYLLLLKLRQQFRLGLEERKPPS